MNIMFLQTISLAAILLQTLSIEANIFTTAIETNSDGTCRNNREWTYEIEEKTWDCGDIQFVESRRLDLCEIDDVHHNCPIACGICCEDDLDYTFERDNGMTSGCDWLTANDKNEENRLSAYCDTFNSGIMVRAACPKSCGYCFPYVSLSPSSNPTISTAPTVSPSSLPTTAPSLRPSLSNGPTQTPSTTHSYQPSMSPTTSPSAAPSMTAIPSGTPSEIPSLSIHPTSVHSQAPSLSNGPSAGPSLAPSASLSPTITLTTVPSGSPSDSLSPSASPSFSPSVSTSPSVIPSGNPSKSMSPTAARSVAPSISMTPTLAHSHFPSLSNEPSAEPSQSPSVSVAPSAAPSSSPSVSTSPSVIPSGNPTAAPSFNPSVSMTPTLAHSHFPSLSNEPSAEPSQSPSVSLTPSAAPSSSPSVSTSPSVIPSGNPSESMSPTAAPSVAPSMTSRPSDIPSNNPSVSMSPSASPSLNPSMSLSPSGDPSHGPSMSISPSTAPTSSPSASISPSGNPSGIPSVSAAPSAVPSSIPSGSSSPTITPSQVPSLSLGPSTVPSATPSVSLSPSAPPSSSPSFSTSPTVSPSDSPTVSPSKSPTLSPSKSPTLKPSSSPTSMPTSSPTSVPTSAPSETKPNLIMILTDEHNLRTLSVYRDYLLTKHSKEKVDVWGDVHLNTPNIDSLATDGALFTNFYTVSPLCTPSRASFMTGLYPPFTGAADQNNGKLDTNIKTWADILRDERGYTTSYMGKFHLDGEEKPGWGAPDGREFGFDDNTYRYNRGHWKYFDEINGKVKEYEMDGEANFQGRQNEHFATDFLVNRGMTFIENASKSKQPFALVLSIPDPHSPNDNRPFYRNMFQDLDFKVPETARKNLKFNPAAPGWNYFDKEEVPLDTVDDFIADYEKTFFVDHMQQYYGMVKCIDYNIGKLLDKMRDLGIEDDTVVVFTSDHGDLMAEHGKLNKGRPYETSAGIPFIVKYPDRVPAGKIIETAYSSVDFAPTILSLMGVSKIPSGVKFQGVDGSKELMSQQKVTANDDQIIFSFDTGNTPTWAAAIKNGIKLVVTKGDVPWLFDIYRDPDEMFNFATYWEHQDVYAELREAMIRILKEYQVPLTEITNTIFLDMPACIDSRDVLPLNNDKIAFCSDIGGEVSADKCDNQYKVRQHCPSTCNACACEDSPGWMWVNSSGRRCETLKSQCNMKAVQTFCPKTCGMC